MLWLKVSARAELSRKLGIQKKEIKLSNSKGLILIIPITITTTKTTTITILMWILLSSSRPSTSNSGYRS